MISEMLPTYALCGPCIFLVKHPIVAIIFSQEGMVTSSSLSSMVQVESGEAQMPIM